MVQPIRRAPPSRAAVMSSGSVWTECSFMTCLIMAGPIPAMFICDSGSFSGPDGIIMPNMRSSADLSRTGGFSRRRAFRPQKVKNIDTFCPIAIAPLAMMNDARTLSRSPEKTTNETWSFVWSAGADATAPPLRNRAT